VFFEVQKNPMECVCPLEIDIRYLCNPFVLYEFDTSILVVFPVLVVFLVLVVAIVVAVKGVGPIVSLFCARGVDGIGLLSCGGSISPPAAAAAAAAVSTAIKVSMCDDGRLKKRA